MNHPEAKGDRRWLDLWNAAVTVDLALRDCRNQEEVIMLLGRDDGCELHLRRLAAYVYEKRTGDRRGAEHMLAQAAPGAGTDIGPTWLVSEATLHSKTEHSRDER
eukprot:6957717-Lingulodinium_polyedra.AAC.1